jgi:hypothetical protein
MLKAFRVLMATLITLALSAPNGAQGIPDRVAARQAAVSALQLWPQLPLLDVATFAPDTTLSLYCTGFSWVISPTLWRSASRTSTNGPARGWLYGVLTIMYSRSADSDSVFASLPSQQPK